MGKYPSAENCHNCHNCNALFFSRRSSEILLLEMMCQVFFYKQHALKGQKLLAQGSALGIMSISKAPCKGKSFVCYPVF